jgi:hypothetical protein
MLFSGWYSNFTTHNFYTKCGEKKIAFSTLLVSKKVKFEVGKLRGKKFLRAVVCKKE